MSIQLYEKDKDGITVERGLAKEIQIEKDGYTEVDYIKVGDPKIINILY